MDLSKLLRATGWVQSGFNELSKESNELSVIIVNYYCCNGFHIKSHKREFSDLSTVLVNGGVIVEVSCKSELVEGVMPSHPKDVIIHAGYWGKLNAPEPEKFKYNFQVGLTHIKLTYPDSFKLNGLIKYLPSTFSNIPSSRRR